MKAFYQIISFFFVWDFQPGNIIEGTTRVAIFPIVFFFQTPYCFLLSSTVMANIYSETYSDVHCYVVHGSTTVNEMRVLQVCEVETLVFRTLTLHIYKTHVF